MKKLMTKAFSTLIAASALLTIIPGITGESLAYADVPRVSVYKNGQSNAAAAQPAAQHKARKAKTAYWDRGLANGFTAGLGLGWYGQYLDGKNTENGVAISMDVGFKWYLFGIEADFDMSISPTEYADETVNTYSFTGMLMGYLPIGNIMMGTIGFGVGYTRWTLEREYREYIDYYDYWGYAGTDEITDTDVLKSCGDLSLKLAARLDFLISEKMVIGLEFNWIPMIHEGDIVNNIYGVKLRFGI